MEKGAYTETTISDIFQILSKDQEVLPCLRIPTIEATLSRGVLRKRLSVNMQHNYRRTPMPKCDSNKIGGLLLQQFFLK